MGKHKDGKKHKKGSQFAIRVDKAERDAFVSLCDTLDTSAAREIRRFMRGWVAANAPKPVDAHKAEEETKRMSAAELVSETDDSALVQAEETGSQAKGTVSAAGSDADVAEDVKSRRKAARRP